MQDINKKALSEIVTSIFLIVVVLAAVSLIGVLIKNTITPVKFSPEDLCINDPELKITSLCYNQQNSDLEITISKETSENIEQFYFIVGNSQETQTYCCGTDCKNCKIPVTEKKYYIYSNEKPEQVSIRLKKCVLSTKQVSICQ